jgi:hypothetical protein
MNLDKYFFEEIFNFKYNKDVDETIYYNEECISKCYPKNTLFYLTSSNNPKIMDKNICSILPDLQYKNKDRYIECESNNFTDNISDNDNLLNILINNSYSFLNNIYNLKTYEDTINFIEMNIKELPIITQKRILNCIYCAYINYPEFPNKKYIFKVKNVLDLVYNIKVHSNKIYNKIIKLKNNNKYKNNNDIFLYIYSKLKK